ncbi:BA14K family protein [Rhizobium sp. BK376]|uniref:BA14K family protein n=1 Tax=Rhizobium sp. BK376 TaxID=2512149 RepID=UPI0010500F2D|nr:BA14K family protein [Rhizobium sp. BK376]TCR83956.1 BA14K-like protein [Rhizobium sp. BK376]
MKTITSGIVAGGLSLLMGLSSIGQASAMTMSASPIPQTEVQQPELQAVAWHGGHGHGHVWHNHGGGDGGWHGHGGWHHHGYYGGGWHHGYYHHGYYDDGGAWVPFAALAAGALIAGAASHPAYRTYHSHASWCAARYRTYRASDNTYQPTSGPRAQCR